MARAFQRDLEADAPGPFAVAHRGARAYAPENTLPAFAKAVELGCRMVELDVHSTCDGRVVVHHDDDLLRCTDAAHVWPGRTTYALAEYTAAELQELDAGHWFTQDLRRPAASRQPFLRSLTEAERSAFLAIDPDASLAVVRIPLLSEVLAWAARTGVRVNIELKPTLRESPRLAERTLASIADAGMVERVLISSFDPAQLTRTRALSADVATGLLTDASLPDALALLAALDADALHPNCADADCLADLHAARAAGHLAFPWTCNDAPTMRLLIAAGATGVITDYPNRMDDVTSQPASDCSIHPAA